MQVKQERLTEEEIERLTRRQSLKLENLLKKAELIKADLDKKKRTAAHICVLCYYHTEGTLAMQAFTDTNCSLCDKEMRFSSSAIDKICNDCAEENKLCVECGCKISLKKGKS